MLKFDKYQKKTRLEYSLIRETLFSLKVDLRTRALWESFFLKVHIFSRAKIRGMIQFSIGNPEKIVLG